MYRIPELNAMGVDFNEVYSDKQEAVKTATGMDFTLYDIVQLLREETKDFSVSNRVAEDIDNAIYNLTIKYLTETGKMPEVEMPEEEEVEEQDQVSEWKDAIETLNTLIELGGSKKQIKEWQDAIETLNLLIGE